VIKTIIYLAIIGAFIYFGATVKLGKRTFFGHVRAIWHTEEVQDLKEGVEEKAGPAVKRVKKGVESALSDDDTKWVTLDGLAIEAEIPSCASAVVRNGQAVLSTPTGASCSEMHVFVHPTNTTTLDAEATELEHTLVPTPRIERKETTANGWVIELDHEGSRHLYQQVAIGGRAFLCANGMGSDMASVRRTCASLRAPK
jgi:hypothetical protein